MPILKIKDAEGNIQEILAIKGDPGAQGEKGPQGEVGPKGDPGENYILTEKDKREIASMIEPGSGGGDGFSPIATVTEHVGGAFISITDKNGTTTANVRNGEDGEDGFSPVVEVIPNYGDSVHSSTVKITDRNGTHTFVVSDGVNGLDGHTPIKGEDYYTEKEKSDLVEEIKSYVDEQILGGAW
jgi:hypothetical protein